jgi:hypothetical protein
VTLTAIQRRMARRFLKLGMAPTWLEACDLARAARPDTSADLEGQLARSLARQHGKHILA